MYVMKSAELFSFTMMKALRTSVFLLPTPGSKIDSTEDPQCIGPAQVPYLSSDRGSILRCPSQNSPRVTTKWGVNITKLNSYS
ncbi:hypothetical protein AVEN_17653-1 [Araneus ventricosus]|uniref:Uncharacterized protein n=1 Tax=Araneus ventricosus TaxID=182803 RepID=A0A4Y2US11_ARAVE|nr:hypothetical protein AVEN_17653-1 [Araneus ventricosus]